MAIVWWFDEWSTSPTTTYVQASSTQGHWYTQAQPVTLGPAMSRRQFDRMHITRARGRVVTHVQAPHVGVRVRHTVAPRTTSHARRLRRRWR